MGGKKIKGRKRHLLVDTLGLPIRVCVLAADISDSAGARRLLTPLAGKLPRLARLWADSAYRGELEGWVAARFGCPLEIVTKLAGQVGFVVQPKRWVVERTFAWLGRARRLSKDYEHHTKASESMIYLASIHLLVRRLATSS
jgi:transposase